MMPTGFRSGTLDLLALRYEPVATLPGLAVARYRTLPDPSSRHWYSLSPRPAHRCGPAGAISERTEFMVMTALSKASYWSHAGRWREPAISVPIATEEMCEHSSLPRLLARAMGASQVRARHLTVELPAATRIPLESVTRTLTRLQELGVRISYAAADVPESFNEFPFDEARVPFNSHAAATAHQLGTRNSRRQSLLAAGVTTGDHLMAALSAEATHIDGAFAGLVRSDRTGVGTTIRSDDALAYS